VIISSHIKKVVEFAGELNHQDIENDDKNLPEASAVLEFMDNQKK